MKPKSLGKLSLILAGTGAFFGTASLVQSAILEGGISTPLIILVVFALAAPGFWHIYKRINRDEPS